MANRLPFDVQLKRVFCFFFKRHKNLLFGRLLADEESSPAKGEKRKRDPEDEDEEDDD